MGLDQGSLQLYVPLHFQQGGPLLGKDRHLRQHSGAQMSKELLFVVLPSLILNITNRH